MYTLNETGYSLFFQYNSERGEQQENIENINNYISMKIILIYSYLI